MAWQRRGFLGRLCVIKGLRDPYECDRRTKWAITTLIACATVTAPLGSSILYPALPKLTLDLRTTDTVGNLTVALYMLSMAVFPLWWSSLSEHYGRRMVYISSLACMVLFSSLCAIASDISMLVVVRLCAGGSSACVQAVGAATISDIWESRERGRAVSLYYLGPLLGPLLAPLLGAALTERFDWRATMWFMTVLGAVVFVAFLFLLPETLTNKEAEHVAANSATVLSQPLGNNKQTASTRARAFFFGLVGPLKIVGLMRFPLVAITVLLAATGFGCLFVANIAIQDTFSRPPYRFSEISVGLMYIPAGLGYITASVFGGKWLDYLMIREAKRASRYDGEGNCIYLPEDRMQENIWLASLAYPLGLLLYGWTSDRGLVWPIPAVGAYIYGVASMLVFAAATTMLTELVEQRRSSGPALSNLMKNLLSCLGTVGAAPWLRSWGAAWVFTAMCIFCLVVSFGALGMVRVKGKQWRERMKTSLEQHE